jgi:hypothetical protein
MTNSLLARSRNSLAVAPLVLATIGLLSGCSSSTSPNATDAAATALGRKIKPPRTPAPTPTPPPSVSTASVYDTSIGLGVDSAGFANLPLRVGAHRYFVNSATGSDANGCAAAEQPTRPLKTIDAGKTCLTLGGGDQLLIAEGTSYSEGLTNLQAQMGYSAEYPTAIQSYDPADPANEAKYGHAGQGRRPVVNTGGGAQQITCCGSGHNAFLAIRGLDFNPGDKPDQGMSFVGTTDYILIENNLFRYTAVGFDIGGQGRSTHHVLRHNSFYGEWSPTGSTGGIYDAGTDLATIEDNVFWHTGWRLGVSRDADVTVGGPTYFRHPIYQQTNSIGFTIRRNLFMDGAADGGSLRNNVTFTENVSIDDPIGVGVGGQITGGSSSEVSYNAFIGDADVNSAYPRGDAIWGINGQLGSSIHHNLIVRRRDPTSLNGYALHMEANLGNDSTFDVHDNLIYLWSSAQANNTLSEIGGTALHLTYNYNVWDAPASGTNVNNGSKSYSNPYTSVQLFAALGCSDKAGCAAQMIESPELGWGIKARTLLWQGYGL